MPVRLKCPAQRPFQLADQSPLSGYIILACNVLHFRSGSRGRRDSERAHMRSNIGSLFILDQSVCSDLII